MIKILFRKQDFNKHDYNTIHGCTRTRRLAFGQNGKSRFLTNISNFYK